MATLHQIALPHVPVLPEFTSCAYTQKVRKFAPMMDKAGWDVVTYAGTGSEVEAGKLEVTHELPPPDSYDHSTWYPLDWSAGGREFSTANAAVIDRLRDTIAPDDIICLIGGTCQKPIADAFPNHTVCEHGVGYEGVFSNFRAFESYAWMHYIYGKSGEVNGRFYDTVIPNFYDVDEFPLGDNIGDYLLYIGRVIHRKGVDLAVEVAKRTGRTLKVAGQCDDKSWSMIDYPHVDYVGVVDAAGRADLMSNAHAVIVPTIYIEPFGGVAAEAQLCGTPVIATDFGAFSETVIDHSTGYRFRTVGEAVWAVENVPDLLWRPSIQERAQGRWSTYRVGAQFSAWFDQLAGLRVDGGDFYTDGHSGVSQHHRYG